MKKKKGGRGRRSTALDRRQRQGKKVLSPFSRVRDVTNWTSWKNDYLLNILWACVLTGSLDREHYLDLFRKVSVVARSLLKDTAHASLCYTFLSTLDQNTFNDIFSPLATDNRARVIVQCLTHIEGLPDKEHWRRLCSESEPSPESWKTLARGVHACFDHQSQEATDVRWLKVFFLTICGKLRLPRSSDSSQKDDLVEELRLYPDHGDMRRVRPTIRALETGIRSIGIGTENETGVPTFEAEIVWDELFQKTECILGARDKPTTEDRQALIVELTDIVDQLLDHFQSSLSTTNIDARMDASFGIALYSLTLIYELAQSPGRLFASGRIMLRTITECFITLAYLSTKDEPTTWLQYRNYGVGQTALAFMKTAGLDDVPDFIDVEKLELLANEDAWMEFCDVQLGAWANKNLRTMSEEVSVKDVYDKYYDWPSGFVHGHWGSIRDSVFSTCLNPLHRFHRVPHPLQPLPSVLVDCCKLGNRILDRLCHLYPGFDRRIRWDN